MKCCYLFEFFQQDEKLYLTDHDRMIEFESKVYIPFHQAKMNGFLKHEALKDDEFQVEVEIGDDASAKMLNMMKNDALLQFKICQFDWHDETQLAFQKQGFVKKVKQNGARLNLRLSGFADLLNVGKWRLLQENCDAKLGDQRCRFKPNVGALKVNVIATETANHQLVLRMYKSLANIDDAPLKLFINDKQYELAPDEYEFLAAQKLRVKKPKILGELGDEGSIEYVCDQQYQTCAKIFKNGVRFKGFAHMPGKDMKFTYPKFNPYAEEK